ncbi:type II toxin-antitoxin system VapC family toxin [candidate division KSB1 bacterium]|nr:type II toxin-antitoxin system VapC family toxin [candidate division KSB1 bacterium]
MIILDTHIWIWWVHGDSKLPKEYQAYLQEHEKQEFGVSIISCWEIAKLVQYNRLELPCSISEWFNQALLSPYIRLIDLTTEIIIESTQLPDPFHKDPTDQLIVATARYYHCPLMTVDRKLLGYSSVENVPIK